MPVDGKRRKIPSLRTLIFMIPALFVAGVASWAVLPRWLGRIAVEQVRLVPVDPPAGKRGQVDRMSPVRIAVTFTATRDLERVRRKTGLGYVAAQLFDCRKSERHTMEVAAQQAGILVDEGRVRPLAATPDGRARYLALFDAQLAEMIDHEARFTPALTTPGGLCLSLYGASMWFGHGRSNSVPLAPFLPSQNNTR